MIQTGRGTAGRAARKAAALEAGTHTFCGVAAAAGLLGDAWTLLLVRDLEDGPRRFTELEASTGISPRVLTDRLRSLCDCGLMTRRMYPEIPPRVEYELTDKGRDVIPIIESLRAYGERWLRPETMEPAVQEAQTAPSVSG
jgi:DNA-binding HxlR family transcriptional regulator